MPDVARTCTYTHNLVAVLVTEEALHLLLVGQLQPGAGLSPRVMRRQTLHEAGVCLHDEEAVVITDNGVELQGAITTPCLLDLNHTS